MTVTLIIATLVFAVAILAITKLKFWFVPLAILIVIIVGLLLASTGFFVGSEVPREAVKFANQNMIYKDNVTFTDKATQTFDTTTLWVTDSEGNAYSVVYYSVYTDIEIGRQYRIGYIGSNFKRLWKAERI